MRSRLDAAAAREDQRNWALWGVERLTREEPLDVSSRTAHRDGIKKREEMCRTKSLKIHAQRSMNVLMEIWNTELSEATLCTSEQ